MKRKLIVGLSLSLILSVYALEINAQTTKKIYNINEIEFLIGTGTNNSNISTINAIRIRTGLAAYINQHVSMGVSLGTDNYRNSEGFFGTNFNTLPVVLRLGYFKKQDFSGLNADLYSGYAVPVFSDFEKGLTCGAGIGYNFKSGKHSNFGIQTGYNFQQINDLRFSNNQVANLNLHSIRAGIKLIFK